MPVKNLSCTTCFPGLGKGSVLIAAYAGKRTIKTFLKEDYFFEFPY
jgi:hypothetical protein